MDRRDKRATRAVIHLDALAHNLDCIRRQIGEGRKICAAVKADAYGHGALAVARRALEWGVDFLAVATVEEGAFLRDRGIAAPILLFSLCTPSEMADLVRRDLRPFVGDRSYAEALNREAAAQGKVLPVHLKIDTGMGRIGAAPPDAPDLAAAIAASEQLRLEGCCTHFPVSDSPDGEDRRFTAGQIALFGETIRAIREKGVDPGILHSANSGALIAHKDSLFDMVRPGICLYGYYPDPRMARPLPFRPVMELSSRVCFVKKVKQGTPVSYGRTWRAPRDGWIATIPAGYADGYPRFLSSRGRVVIRGRSYPIAGRICMDQFMVDLGAETEVVPGDEVLLFGSREGAPTAEEIAALGGTIPYEITCGVNKRVPREYRG